MNASFENVVDVASKVAHGVASKHAAACDEHAAWPEETLRALQAAGAGGLVVPERYGGLGHGLSGLLRVCDRLGEVDASAALCFGMHCVGTACVAAKASPSQAEEFLRPIAEGKHLTTLALSEPGSGSHFYLPQARLEKTEEGYVVTGSKCFVTNGGHADSYVVSVVAADPDAPPGHFSMLVVPADSAGIRWGQPWSGWGMRGNASRSLDLDSVGVSREHLLGDEGEQIWYVFNAVAPYFLVAMAGTYLGLARRAMSEAVEHLKGRSYTHTGGALAEVEVLQHRTGELWAQYQRTRQLCLWAAEAGDAGAPDALPALCSAKAEVATAAVNIVNECMTLVGGSAYRDGSVLTRLLRDARAAHVMSPTTDILYTWTGRALLDIPILSG